VATEWFRNLNKYYCFQIDNWIELFLLFANKGVLLSKAHLHQVIHDPFLSTHPVEY
jgi:hypothetical protein